MSEIQRSLAHIEQILNLEPISNYDRVELATVLGWKVVVRKGEFEIGSKCCYFEIDSKLPEKEWSEFLRPKHFKVKTQKMCGVISQGLALPISLFPKLENLEIGTDVTEQLGVKYSVQEDNIRKSKHGDPEAKYKSMAARHQKLFKSKPVRCLMKRKWGKKLMFFLFGRKKDKPKAFPTHFEFVHKTDETRCENIPWILGDKRPYIKTLKIDGTSSTYILERKKRNKFEFYVLSRNIRQLTPDQKSYHDENVYWNMAKKYKIEEFLKDQLEMHPGWTYACLQGETAGVGVQGNPHKLNDTYFYGFNFIDSFNGRRNSVQAKQICEAYGIPWVPILDDNYILPDSMEELKLDADGLCDLPGSSGLREGFVYRSHDGKTSFKNVSRKYLLKQGL